VTEKEARGKWCPFARSSDGNRLGGFTSDFPLNCLCIGSGCMAWRWEKVADSLALDSGYHDSKTLGHCGLAR